MRVVEAILHNFWAKLFSLILAVATWFYVFDIINNESYSPKKETVEEVFERYDFMVKELPVKPVYTGTSPNGYQIDYENVVVRPATVSVLGPENVLGPMEELETERINIGEYTRSASVKKKIRTSRRSLRMNASEVEIYLPVVPVGKK